MLAAAPGRRRSDSPGSDDSRWITLEVRYVSGTDRAGSWTLTVQGNTQ